MKPSTLITIIVVLLLPIGAYFLTSSMDKSKTSSTPSPTPSPSASAMQDPADVVSATSVTLTTSMGAINLKLYPEDAPLAVKNFVTLGKRGYYNGVIFHRVIAGFMDQAGDPDGSGTGGQSIYGRYFKTEINSRQFKPGVLGAARTNAMDTNGSQFFIMAAEAASLNNQYTVFGETADEASLAVVKAINVVKTDASDKPLSPVTITGFTINQ